MSTQARAMHARAAASTPPTEARPGAGAGDPAVVDVQRFSLHDGPGIRTTVFFKGCVLRCAWCQNPESLRLAPEIAFYAQHCRDERRCVAACPRGAVLAGPTRIDWALCDACGRCADACGHDALRLVGRRWPVDRLVTELLKDRAFFEESGGGITLSGGEPMTHAAYLRRLLPRLAAEGIPVTLQTCGLFPWDWMEPLLPWLALVQFDLKHLDDAAHARLTGAGNARILANFANLVASDVPLEPRMPVIPGLNDGADNVRATARFLRRHGHTRLRCLPYHNLGEAKQRAIAPILAPLGLPSLDPRALAPIARAFAAEGIDVVSGD